MAFSAAEGLQGGDHLFDVVGEGEQQVLVFAGLHQVLNQRINRNVLGPETLAQENHRAGETEGEVVVLHRLLENLLQGVPAHDAHVAAMVVGLEEVRQCHVDAVVVQGARQQLLHVVGVLPHRRVALVNDAVKATAVTGLVIGIESLIELHGVIE